MKDVIVFAGTSEGRQLYDFCSDRQIAALFCVATEYGRNVLIDRFGQKNKYGDATHDAGSDDNVDGRAMCQIGSRTDERTVEEVDDINVLCKLDGEAGSKIRISVGRLSQEEMTALFLREKPCIVIDATHPYAVEVTANIQGAVERYRQAAYMEGQVYYRVLRSLSEQTEDREQIGETWVQGTEKPCIEVFSDMSQAVEYLNRTEGNILVTTGSKQLFELCKLDGYDRRIYLRILPSPDMLQVCLDNGFPASHMICMQGPFTEEMNTAVMRQYNIRYLLTKQSGATGGFPEKYRAAQMAGARLLVLLPPREWEGVGVAEMEQIILMINR